jgi:hypothetical protein
MLIKNEDGSYQKFAGKSKGDIIEYSGVSFPDKRDTVVFTFATDKVNGQQSNNNQGKDDTPTRTRGAGEGTPDLQYLLYPNPVKMNDYFTVKFPATEGLEITLYDGGGRKISSEKITPNTTEYHNKLNVQGVYLILTQNKALIKAFKLIVD